MGALMGVSPATIRSWEKRYGWPVSVRTAGGHRRYRRGDLATFRRVARLRQRLPIKAAIARATGGFSEGLSTTEN
ncbi:MAG: MerR family transcriptional regulator [Actinomycetota bacterium]